MQTIGRYQVKRLIGQGGMARVYLAYDPNFRRDVALKIMSARMVDKEAFRLRFAREGRAIAALEHYAIVPVYDYGEEGNRPYLVMRLMHGGSLAERLRQGPLPPAVIQRVLERIGSALDKAHENGIVHRDLKPGNILFDDDGQPYLSDFGIIKSAQSTRLTATGGMIGTPAYMSPEQVLGKEDLDGRSDIYALGAVLYEMLTGRQPYDSETGMGLAMAHLTQPVPRLSDAGQQLPAGYQAIINRAMAKEPDERYQHGADLAAAFRSPPAVSTDDSTVIEKWDDHTVIESISVGAAASAASATTAASATPEPAPPPKKGGFSWKIVAPLLLLAIVAFAVFMMRDVFLPPSDTVAPLPPTTDSAYISLAATVTAQAQEMTMDAAIETTEAEVRGTVEAEMEEATNGGQEGEDEAPASVDDLYDEDEAGESPPDEELVAEEPPTEEPPTDTPVPPTDTPVPPTDTPVPTDTPDLGPEWNQVGRTYDGDDIDVVRFGAGPNDIVLVGGLHAGFAPASVTIAEGLIRHFDDNPHEVPAGITLYIVPIVNRDSPHAPGEWIGRANGNDVDMNRNWDCDWIRDATWRGQKVTGSGGSAPFSEPETKALRDLFLDIRPEAVVFWEARITDGLISPGKCRTVSDTTRASYALAGVYGSASRYSVADYEAEANQVINGDANNWLDSVGIPSIAVILDQYEEPNWKNNLEGVRALLAYYGD